MKTYRLRQAAARDILELGRYTQHRWGPAQRRIYLHRLRSRLEALAQRPRAGVARSDLGPGYRSFREARHIIFFVEQAYGIEVVRILHERMDVVRHLRGASDPDDEPADA